ncbi:MAG: 5-formyltetrahydrofolate cyclo-ligase [Acidimicrobiales bacterium]
MTSKEALRLEMRRLRREIPAEERERRGRRITASVLLLPEIRGARVVLAFSSFGSEVPTEELLAALEEAGVTVLLPYVTGGDMFATEYHEGDALVRTTYGPREPALRRPVEPGRIEAVVVPGLAFDRGGGRLGYGGGYYDRFLRQLPDSTALIGIAFADQVVDEVPLSTDDVKVYLVVTEEEVVRCRPGGGGAGSS